MDVSGTDILGARRAACQSRELIIGKGSSTLTSSEISKSLRNCASKVGELLLYGNAKRKTQHFWFAG
jgi:hypothetical protein